MANTVDNTILLKTASEVVQSEKTAAGVITPGEFIEITSSDECQRQSTTHASKTQLTKASIGVMKSTHNSCKQSTTNKSKRWSDEVKTQLIQAKHNNKSKYWSHAKNTPNTGTFRSDEV